MGCGAFGERILPGVFSTLLGRVMATTTLRGSPSDAGNARRSKRCIEEPAGLVWRNADVCTPVRLDTANRSPNLRELQATC